MDAPVKVGTAFADLMRQKLNHTRTQLIERNLRNKLLNCALTSKRAKQLASVWQLDGAGSRIQDVTHCGLKALRRRGELSNEGPFWMHTGAQTVRSRDRSQTHSTRLKKAEYLPPSEVVQVATEVVKNNVRLPLEQLVIGVAGCWACSAQAQISKTLLGSRFKWSWAPLTNAWTTGR